MKRYIIIISVLLFINSCSILLLDKKKHSRGENPYDPMTSENVNNEPDGSWVFMVYLDAANNLESAGVSDLTEMTRVDFSAYAGKNIKIIVLMDRIDGYSTADGDWKGTKLYEIGANGSLIVKTGVSINGKTPDGTTGNDVNMGDPNSLQDFIEYIMLNYSADYYLLDIWNHGGGWRGETDENTNDIRKAIAWDDESNGDTLYMHEVQTAIKNALQTVGKSKLDIIYMDACLMQMAEVGYEMRNYVNYLVASEETVPGNGGDYTDILTKYKELDTHSPYLFSKAIVKSYREQYYATSDTTLSAVDLRKFSSLMNAIDLFADDLVKQSGSTIKSIRSKTKDFAYPDQADLYHFAKLCSEQISDVHGAKEVMDAIDGLMVKEYHQGSSMADCHGMAIYFPGTPDKVDSSYWDSEYDIEFDDNSKWTDFIKWYKNQ